MTSQELKSLIIDELNRIAPEVDSRSIDSSSSLRDQLDLDSMDFLKFMLALHDRLRVEIPEADYPRLATLDGAAAYLSAQLSRLSR